MQGERTMSQSLCSSVCSSLSSKTPSTGNSDRSDQSACFSSNWENKKRQRTNMTGRRSHFKTYAESKEYIDAKQRRQNPEEVERLNRMTNLRNMWDKHKDLFMEILGTYCLHGKLGNVHGWKSLTLCLIRRLKLKDEHIEITEETFQSCQDYAAELRDVHKACERIDTITVHSKAYGVQSETKDALRNIFKRTKPVFKKLSSASPSSSRKSYGRKSSGTAGTSAPSVHMPNQNFEVRVPDALTLILAAWPTVLPRNIVVQLRDHICSEYIFCNVFLAYSHDRREAFVSDFLTKEGF